jgi:putative NADH-flavin reductase
MPVKLALLGGSGRVGREIIARALERGFEVSAQTRMAERLAEVADRAEVHAFEPGDASRLRGFVTGSDAVIMALGVKSRGPTTLFSDTTRVLLRVMRKSGVRRLIAITGVGAGETRGHGGALYDRIIYPLFTRNRYRDKEVQERLIEASDRDWIIVRPAPFSLKAARSDVEVHTEIGRRTVLRRISVREVAEFVLDQIESDRYLRCKPFIGHP